MLLVQEATHAAAVARAKELVDRLPLVPSLLVHADLTPPLAERTRVFLGFDGGGELRAVGTAYLGLGRPALGIALLPPSAETASWDEALARELLIHVRAGIDLPAFALVDPHQEGAFSAIFKVKARHEETHYLLRPGATLPVDEAVRVERVPREELPALDAFLRAYGATAWSKESYVPHLYFWVREQGEVVAAAGVHFETPVVGQIANVLVRESARRRGFGRAVTTAVARRLRADGKVVSLFVRSDNAGARRLYERLGFVAVRPLVALELE
jgi:ribosomal protein S18 acetylase RimI-like enzyme